MRSTYSVIPSLSFVHWCTHYLNGCSLFTTANNMIEERILFSLLKRLSQILPYCFVTSLRPALTASTLPKSFKCYAHLRRTLERPPSAPSTNLHRKCSQCLTRCSCWPRVEWRISARRLGLLDSLKSKQMRPSDITESFFA